MWSQYTTNNLVLKLNDGSSYTGRVQSDNRFKFNKSGDANSYYVAKPTGEQVFSGAPPFFSYNGVENELGKQLCAAFHRHILQDQANLNNASQYYLQAPADYYSKFWHDHSINGRAYGFCYDDINGQDSILSCGSPRGLVVTIGF